MTTAAIIQDCELTLSSETEENAFANKPASLSRQLPNLDASLHLISDQIGFISAAIDQTGVRKASASPHFSSSVNNNVNTRMDPTICGGLAAAASIREAHIIGGDKFAQQSTQTGVPMVQTTASIPTLQTNNTNEDEQRINNNKRRTTVTSTSTTNNLSANIGLIDNISTASSETSTSYSDSPIVMLPQPSRTPMIYEELGPGVEDESVLNLAAALVSISSSSSSSCTSPSSLNVECEKQEEPSADGKVRAYAKLQGADWIYYLKKPSLTMGRAPSQARQFTPGDSCPVDLYLSSADSLSRTHLRIDYNPDRTRWEMSCLGKSGVRVDKRRYEAFCPPIPLFAESVITVANATFHFILPLDVASREGSPFEKMIRKRKLDNAKPDELHKHEGSDTDINHTNNSQTNDENDEYEDTASLVGVGEYSKPPQSYANLIAEAINSTQNKRMTLSCIYQYLADKYPYFRHTKNGWQNSVRHNLSLNKAFKKVPRGLDEPGKGMLWIIDPDYKHLVDGSIGRRATVRSRTPDLANVPVQRPPLTFIHHHQSMFQATYPHNPNTQQMYSQHYQYIHPQPHPHPPFYATHQRGNHPPILPAPDPMLRPIATIAAAISPAATAMSTTTSATTCTSSSSPPSSINPSPTS